MKTFKLKMLSLLIILITGVMPVFSQSGNKNATPTPGVNSTPEKKAESSPDKTDLEKVQFVLTDDFNAYMAELKKFGQLGYRVEKAFNYGGDVSQSAQRFAAVLKKDPEDFFEYDWLTSPNKKFIESRLNAKAALGFYVTHILPLTDCSGKESENDKIEFPAPEEMRRSAKGDVFLLEKRIGKSERVKEYKVLTGKIGIGKNPTTELQTALDSTPAGFHPFKVLFNKAGTFDFSVSVLLEKDLRNENTEKIQYKFFKDVNGFEKEINSLAQTGFQLIAGRRIGLVKFALLAKVPGDASSYILLDADKYQKEFDKKVTSGNVYKGMFHGDAWCDEDETIGAKLVFANTAGESAKPEYKFLKLATKKSIPGNDATSAEIKKLMTDGFFVRDIFYSNGAVLILEK